MVKVICVKWGIPKKWNTPLNPTHPTRSGFSLQCNDFLPGRDPTVFSSSTSSSSSSEYEADLVTSSVVSPSLVHLTTDPLVHITTNRPKPPARRPPSLKSKRKQTVEAEKEIGASSDDQDIKHEDNKIHVVEEASMVVVQRKPKEASSEEEDDEESPFLGRDMLEGEEQIAHLSGEGVRQRFFRTTVIPSLEEEEDVEEEIILGRSSTTSLIDSILSSIDMSALCQPISFPELGRDIVPCSQDSLNPATNLRQVR